jgi:hypothetical protein
MRSVPERCSSLVITTSAPYSLTISATSSLSVAIRHLSTTSRDSTRSQTRMTRGRPARIRSGLRGRRVAPSLAGITASVLIRGARSGWRSRPQKSSFKVSSATGSAPTDQPDSSGYGYTKTLRGTAVDGVHEELEVEEPGGDPGARALRERGKALDSSARQHFPNGNRG